MAEQDEKRGRWLQVGNVIPALILVGVIAAALVMRMCGS